MASSKIACAASVMGDDLQALRAGASVGAFQTAGLNKLFGGIRPEISIIGGTPGLGKTTLAVCIANEIALNGRPVLFLSYEMSRPLILAKSISQSSSHEAPLSEVMLGKVPEETLRNYSGCIGKLLYIQDVPISMLSLQQIVCDIQERHGFFPAICLDYLQIAPTEASLQKGFSGVDARAAVKETLAGLRWLVNSYGAPIYALGAIQRQAYSKTEVGLDFLAEAQNSEYSADRVIHMAPSENARLGETSITFTLKKNRHGETGSVDLGFNKAFALFEDIQ